MPVPPCVSPSILFCCIRSRQAQEGQIAGRLPEGAGLGRGCRCQEAELSRPLSERLLAPVYRQFRIWLHGFCRQNSCLIREKVQQTGRQGGLSPRDYLGLKLLSAIVIPLLVYLLLAGAQSANFALAAYAAVIAGACLICS